MAQINTQITATAGAGNEEVLAVNNAGRIEFQVQAPATQGDYLQIANNSVSSVGLSLDSIGFLTGNRFDNGVEPVQANNSPAAPATRIEQATAHEMREAFQDASPPNGKPQDAIKLDKATCCMQRCISTK